MAEKLYKSGAALKIYDPKVLQDQIIKDIKFYWKVKADQSNRIRFSSSISLGYADAIAVLTEWEEFQSYDYSKELVFDGRHIIKHKTC